MRLSLTLFGLPLFTSFLLQSMAEDLADLVAPDAKAVKVAGDCKFTEGPAWSPAGFLVFSDIPNNRIVQIAADGTSKDWLNPSGRSNGLIFDQAGRLYLCRTEPRAVVRIDDPEKKAITVLAEEFDGKPFNSPNDLALDNHGGVYFTDPLYGRDLKQEQPVQGVYYISQEGKITRVIEDLERPNGILVSADGKKLFVAEPNRRELYSYEITAPGEITAGRLIFTGHENLDGGGPDGMTLDERGNIYATYGSVVVLSPLGELIGRIEVPERPANVEFGGQDGKTLIITARTSVYAVPMQVSGTPLMPASKLTAAVTTSKPAAKEEKTKEVQARDLTLVVPESWHALESTEFRLAQFVVPPVAKDKDTDGGEFVVFFFPMGGGDAAANVKRWAQQFEPEDRKVKVFSGETKWGKYTLADLSGIWNKTVGPPVLRQTKRMEGWRVLAVVLETETGRYYLRFDAPQATAAATETAFRRSFGANAKEEQEQKFELE